jgi:hypothetical protein
LSDSSTTSQRAAQQRGAAKAALAAPAVVSGERALVFGARSYKPVERMLKLGLESTPLPGAEPAENTPIVHENVRGPEYYN